jgi:hypothetical protein
MCNTVSSLVTSYSRDLQCTLAEAASRVRDDVNRQLEAITGMHGQLQEVEWQEVVNAIIAEGVDFGESEGDDDATVSAGCDDEDLKITEQEVAELLADLIRQEEEEAAVYDL